MIRAKRQDQAKKRAARAKKLRRHGRDRTKILFTMGVGPAASYGADVHGMSDAELLKLRRLLISAHTPRAAGSVSSEVPPAATLEPKRLEELPAS